MTGLNGAGPFGLRAIFTMPEFDIQKFLTDWAEQRALLARIDQRQIHMAEIVEELKTADTEARKSRNTLDRKITGIEDRLTVLEGRGIGSWGPKKIAQLAALTAGMGGVFGGAYKAAVWFIEHYK